MAIGEIGGQGGAGGPDDPAKSRLFGVQIGGQGSGASSAAPNFPTYPGAGGGPPPMMTQPRGTTVSDQDLWNAARPPPGGLGFVGNGASMDDWWSKLGAGGETPMVTPAGAPQIPGMGGAGGSGGYGDGGVGTLEGLDFTKPGALEQYQRDHAGYFDTPTMSEMFAKDAISRGGGPGVSNRAEEAYQHFNASTPANMDPYYANERRKAEEAIRKTMSARGSYGSSATDDLYNEAYTNLAADAAKANAQYGLQRAGLMGSLAQGADSSSLAGSGDRRNWTSVLGSLAGQGDNAGLSRVIGGANVAGAAQGAQRTRGQDAFNNQLTMGDRMSGIMGQGYGNIFGADMDLFKTTVGLNTGTAAEGYSQGAQNASIARGNVGNFNNLLGGNTQYFQGLSDMFKGPSGGGTPAPSPMPTYNQNPNGEAELRRAWQYYP